MHNMINANKKLDDETIKDLSQTKLDKIAHLDPNRKRTEGHVIHCDTKIAVLSADVDPSVEYMENYWAVGQLISIWVGNNRVIGQVSKVISESPDWATEGTNKVLVDVELIGEVSQTDRGTKFTNGISSFPQMGCPGHRIRSTDLAAMYESTSNTNITIGHLSQDSSIPAKIDFEKLLTRHFAVVGSTGVGKSTSVSLMLRKVIEARPDLRILMLDPHNEFATAFPRNSMVINAKALHLPFWLFGLEEIAEVIFRGQEDLEIEKEMLRDLVVLAKQHYADGESQSSSQLTRKTTPKSKVNADMPLPYRMIDLLKIIDDRMGLLDNKTEKPMLKNLKDRIETITNDARFQFMFDPIACGGDKIGEVISHIFRVPHNGKPICVMEMSGLPSEVVSSVVSVLCRMAFDLALASSGAIQTLVVCEEAHRYIPADVNAGFWPTRQAIGRIAKEGRKYGVYLGIITQRPGELDPTILSQCNSFFAMRLSNAKDQAIIAGAFNSGAQSTIAFLPSISNRECIAFGEAVYSPMRMTFETVDAKDLPGAHIRENQEAVRAGKAVNLAQVIAKMRGTVEPHLEAPESDALAELAELRGSAPQRGGGGATERDHTQSARNDIPRSPESTNTSLAEFGAGAPIRQQQPSVKQAFSPETGAHLRNKGHTQIKTYSPTQPSSASMLGQRYQEIATSADANTHQAAPSLPAAGNSAPIEKRENAGNALFRAFRAK